MSGPNGQTILAAVTIVSLAALGVVAEIVAIPATNHDLLLVIVSGLIGALTGAGAAKLADKITTSNGSDAIVQPDAPPST